MWLCLCPTVEGQRSVWQLPLGWWGEESPHWPSLAMQVLLIPGEGDMVSDSLVSPLTYIPAESKLSQLAMAFLVYPTEGLSEPFHCLPTSSLVIQVYIMCGGV